MGTLFDVFINLAFNLFNFLHLTLNNLTIVGTLFDVFINLAFNLFNFLHLTLNNLTIVGTLFDVFINLAFNLFNFLHLTLNNLTIVGTLFDVFTLMCRNTFTSMKENFNWMWNTYLLPPMLFRQCVVNGGGPVWILMRGQHETRKMSSFRSYVLEPCPHGPCVPHLNSIHAQTDL